MSSHGVVPDGAEAKGVPNDVHGEFPSTALAEIAKETGETTQTPPKPGGLLRYVSRWNPRTTPRFTTTVLLYLLGLFLAFGAVPPVTISNEMQERYFGQMEFADSLDYAPRMAAERAYQKAQVATHRANGFLCWTNAKCKVKVNHLKHAEQTAKQHANVYREKRAKLVVAAKSELGLWSALGIDEAKALFKKAYDSGKVYATRSSYYDTFFLILNGRSDDSMVELLLRWGFQVLANFTVGMIRAVFHFAFLLPALIRDYGASTLSAVSFFVAALVAGTSVAFSLLLLLFGTAGGVTYGVVAVAPTLMKLEQAQRQQERQRLLREHERRRGGGWAGAAPRREHVD
jgi:hypothetical protein